jgi:hypothetical protein
MSKPWAGFATPISDSAERVGKANFPELSTPEDTALYLAGFDAGLFVAREIERRLEYSMQLMADTADRLLNEDANNE